MAGMAGVAIENSRGNLADAARIGINTFNAVDPGERGILGFELGFLLLKLGYFDEVQANFAPPPPAPFLWRNDPRGLAMIEASGMAPRQIFTMSPMSDAASRIYLRSGRAAELANLYHVAATSPEGFSNDFGKAELVSLAPAIAMALKQTGKAEEADHLL